MLQQLSNSVLQYENFQFRRPGPLRESDFELRLIRTTPADPVMSYVPCYYFGVFVDGVADPVGNIDFRAGSTHNLVMYGGHFAYGIDAAYRGCHLAERGCRLLLPFVREHGMTEIWITCNPDNFPSRRTCERLGAELVEIVDLPEDIDMYREGERQKCRYRLHVG